MRPERVAAAYARATSACPGFPPKFGAKSRPRLIAFADWCATQNVPVEAYIRARHEAVGFKFRFRIDQLPSAKFVVKFREWGADRQAVVDSQTRLASLLADASPAEVLAERIRRVTPPDACAADTLTWWSAASPSCVSCPARCGGASARG